MEELINAMSDEDLAGMKTKYSDNPSVVTLIDGILETRNKALAQAKAKAKFEGGIAKLFVNLPHPEDTYNVYARWAEVEVEDTTKEALEEVEIVDAQAILDDDGKIVTEAVTHTEARYPTVKVFKWVVETNKGLSTARGGTTTPTTSKRAILVSKRDEANPSQLVEVGKFTSASKACEKLGLTIGGDSATRVIQREGLFIEPYEGTDFTS